MDNQAVYLISDVNVADTAAVYAITQPRKVAYSVWTREGSRISGEAPLEHVAMLVNDVLGASVASKLTKQYANKRLATWGHPYSKRPTLSVKIGR